MPVYTVKPPKWLDAIMAVAYPASLGLDEALADLCVRAYSSMLTTCGDPGVSCFTEWVMYMGVLVGTAAGVMSAIFWMPYVFRRYETTVALPIEYGALNAGNIASGLLFYGEHEYMSAFQVSMAIAGCAIILLGIGIGRLERLPFQAAAPQPLSSPWAAEEARRRPKSVDGGPGR